MVKRKKISRKKGICLALAAILAFSGFMGIESFKTEDRVLDLGSEMSEASAVVSAPASEPATGAGIGENGSMGEIDKSDKAFPSSFVVDAKAAVLMDAGSGAVLLSQNGSDRLPPASVTKVMTMLLAMEAIERGQVSLEDTVTISERAASMGGSQMYMEPMEQHSLEEIMLGISMVSANDACVAVAEHLSGSVEIFVENMNKRAAELCLKDTHFVNTNGLPAQEHYSSAHDIAVISRELVKHEKVKEWFGTWQKEITVGLPGKETVFGLTNTNKLIKQYKDANGIKTGFTQEAGYCLAGSASRDGMTLIAVVLGSPSSKIRFAETGRMLDYGFANYDSVKIALEGEAADRITIAKGSPEKINAVTDEDVSILVKKGQQESVAVKSRLSENLQAPVKGGEQVGELIVYVDKNEVMSVALNAEESVKKAGIIELYSRMMKTIID